MLPKHGLAYLAAVVVSVKPAWAQQGYGHGWERPMMGWGWPFSGILMLAFVAAIGMVAVLLVRYFWNVGQHGGGLGNSGGARNALVILDEKYANGEIEREEYLRRKEDLSA